PVKDLDTGRVEVSSHNHGFAVDPGGWGAAALRPESLGGRQQAPVAETAQGRVALTHWNLNDGTLEGLRCLDVPAFSVQYHPEAAPGPHDARYLFDRFRELMSAAQANCHPPDPRDRVGADRDRPALRVRLLGHAGVHGAAPRGLPGGARRHE